ncbi:hypothetical protein CLE01_06990 [Cryobacterium levicorallinum]|nr:hypothetical protein CLE01_06990 [Cryobacterium levicorallinum]
MKECTNAASEDADGSVSQTALRGADARAGSEVKRRWELEGANEIATLDLTVAIAANLNDEGGDGDNGNGQE